MHLRFDNRASFRDVSAEIASHRNFVYVLRETNFGPSRAVPDFVYLMYFSAKGNERPYNHFSNHHRQLNAINGGFECTHIN